MSKFTDKFVIDAPIIGECQINVDEICKVWHKNFWISQWKDEFRIIRNRKGGKSTLMKLTISKDTAMKIIDKMSLSRTQCDTFKHAGAWR